MHAVTLKLQYVHPIHFPLVPPCHPVILSKLYQIGFKNLSSDLIGEKIDFVLADNGKKKKKSRVYREQITLGS